jgi:FMN phosphatase YigB (HAD superfamily)
MKELSSTPFLKNIASITGDARKPDNSEVFHKIGPAGVMFGDSMRNDLIGAIKAGWEYQFLCVNHSPDDSDVVIVTECVVEGV